MKSFILILLCYLSLQQPLSGQSNEGTNFWFSFMHHLDVNDNSKVAMITSKYHTSGTISVPERGFIENFSITANQVTVIPLPAYTETVGSEMINNNAVNIRTEDPVSVYIHQYFNARSEASIVLPVSALGREYFVITYEGIERRNESHPSEFLIVPTQDETEVFITLSDPSVKGKAAGSTFSVILDAGETFQVQADLPNGDLTGTYVAGDKPFALFGGNRWTEVPIGCDARDNLLEQMYPLSTWGKKFVTVPNAKVNFDVFRIVAAVDNTLIIIEDTVQDTFYLDRGQFAEYRRSVPTLINSTQPISIAQFAVGSSCSGHNRGDPSMVILNSIEQTRDTVTLFSSSFQNITENYINVIFRTVDEDNIQFDGQPLRSLPATFGTVGTGEEFGFARLEVEAGAHTIISAGCGVIATAYGYGFVESYAYSGGASFRPINADPIPDGGCLNDTVLFDTGLSPDRFSFQWDLGDGNRSTAARFQHYYPDLGGYTVQLILTDQCLNTVDTIRKELFITRRQAVDAVDDIIICENTQLELSANDVAGARYEWTGPNGFFSEAQFPVLSQSKPHQSGEYSVVGIVSGCITFPEVVSVEIIPMPEPDLGPDTLVCTVASLTSILDPGPFADYRWQDNSRLPTYTVAEEGVFWVEVTDEFGCKGIDTVRLREQCPTEIYLPNAFSPNGDGINDAFAISGHDIITIHLSIFDRWGNLLFESFDQNQAWNGFHKGKLLDNGVYVWILEIEGYRLDGTTFSAVQSGSVTLIR